MTGSRHTDRRLDDPPPINSNLRSERGNAAMWGWVAGIAVVILIAFILAAGWNSNVETASKAPLATTGAAPTTEAVPPPATTGSGAGVPAMAPKTPAPNSAPAK